LVFRPAGAHRASRFYPRLSPWLAFLRRFAACGLTDSFALSVEILFLTHTLEAAPLQGIAYVPELTCRAYCMAC
jgi:hypothetical protein